MKRLIRIIVDATEVRLVSKAHTHATVACLLTWGLGTSSAGVSWAQAGGEPNPVPDRVGAAMQHVLQPSVGSRDALPVATPAGAVADGAAARTEVVVRPGETLDRVIARTLKDSPFRVEVLREAFVSLNRGRFPRGTPHRVAAGATLLVPTLSDVLSVVDPQPQQPAASAMVQPKSTGPTPEADRRNWVRYP